MRFGTTLRATLLRSNEHCEGHWLAVEPEGYVCTSFGFRMLHREVDAPERVVPPRLSRPMPFRYAMVVDRTAHRFERMPTERELERIAEGAELPSLAEPLDGDYFVAIAGEVDRDEQTWIRTVSDDFVPASAVEPVEPSGLVGVHDPDGIDLPLAFVYREDARVVSADGRASQAAKYERFAVKEIRDDEVISGDGVRVPADAVRIVERETRPDDVPEGARWIHVNLDQQTIVAYEGDRPVFASLVATGKEGYDTPAGTFRIRHKYLTITMRGEDPIDGVYDVAEVPWTMYYSGSYALHGAYWHDSFGAVRSHGCTNIAPADARFLFTWTTPRVPEGWHGVREDGTWVHLTRASAD